MGRKNTRNLNMPPQMHPRTQRSGKVYFYMFTGDKPRKEIPLGSDFILALRKYAELNVVDTPSGSVLFEAMVIRYQLESLPKLAKNTIKMHRSDLKHLLIFFKEAPLDQIRPTHIKQFLEKHSDKPTTANRCKRLFSVMWNRSRGWGYTDLPNPCEGIKGFALSKRTNYITDALYAAVYKCASDPLKDAMDLAYLTGQRPADALNMSEHDIIDGHLIITQEKTKQPLRIVVSGELAALIERIKKRKRTHAIVTSALLVNLQGKRLTSAVLRNHFDEARKLAAEADSTMEAAIKSFHFYDLRAKAADDTSDARGDQAASDLLGHDSVKTTQKHYLRRGKIVTPTR
jgi:integrase